MRYWHAWKLFDMFVFDLCGERGNEHKLASIMFRRDAAGALRPETVLIGLVPTVMPLDLVFTLLGTLPDRADPIRDELIALRKNIVLFMDLPDPETQMYGWVADLTQAEAAASRYRTAEIRNGTPFGKILAKLM